MVAASCSTQLIGKTLGLGQVLQRAVQFAQRLKRRSQVEPEIDPLLHSSRHVGAPGQRCQRLLETDRRVPIRRTRERLTSRQGEIEERLVPDLSFPIVHGQATGMGHQISAVELLDGPAHPCVEKRSPGRQQPAPGNLADAVVHEVQSAITHRE